MKYKSEYVYNTYYTDYTNMSKVKISILNISIHQILKLFAPSFKHSSLHSTTSEKYLIITIY